MGSAEIGAIGDIGDLPSSWRYNPMLQPTQGMLNVNEAAMRANSRCYQQRPPGATYDILTITGSWTIHGIYFMVTFGGGTVRMFLGRDCYLYRISTSVTDEGRRERGYVARLAEYSDSQLLAIEQALDGLTFPVGHGFED